MKSFGGVQDMDRRDSILLFIIKASGQGNTLGGNTAKPDGT